MNGSIKTGAAGAALTIAALAAIATGAASSTPASDNTNQTTTQHTTPPRVTHATETIDGLEIFYREAGPEDAPRIVLLHGFPTSSHMFRDLIPQLATDFRVIAPDYPGYGLSSAPANTDYDYTFDNLADVVDELLERKGYTDYVLYVMDYGAPVGFRIATEHPERVNGFVVQNGNAYVEGLEEFWNPIKAYWNAGKDAQTERDALRALLTLEATKWQYFTGVRDESVISPDNWLVIQPLLDRPGNQEIQLDLFFDYSTNPPPLPRVAAVLPRPPAAHADHLGQERPHLPRLRRIPLPA